MGAGGERDLSWCGVAGGRAPVCAMVAVVAAAWCAALARAMRRLADGVGDDGDGAAAASVLVACGRCLGRRAAASATMSARGGRYLCGRRWRRSRSRAAGRRCAHGRRRGRACVGAWASAGLPCYAAQRAVRIAVAGMAGRCARAVPARGGAAALCSGRQQLGGAPGGVVARGAAAHGQGLRGHMRCALARRRLAVRAGMTAAARRCGRMTGDGGGPGAGGCGMAGDWCAMGGRQRRLAGARALGGGAVGGAGARWCCGGAHGLRGRAGGPAAGAVCGWLNGGGGGGDAMGGGVAGGRRWRYRRGGGKRRPAAVATMPARGRGGGGAAGGGAGSRWAPGGVRWPRPAVPAGAGDGGVRMICACAGDWLGAGGGRRQAMTRR